MQLITSAALLLLCDIPAAAQYIVQLPSVPYDAASSSAGAMSLLEFDSAGKWWARIGDRVYYKPEPGQGLSERVSDYYYTVGSKQALTNEMNEHKVGGEGRLHLLHFPSGSGPPASMLQSAMQKADRRSALSAFVQLQHGEVLSNDFPLYSLVSEYINPLSGNALDVEKNAVGEVKSANVDDFLDKIVSLGGSTATRSWRNAEASGLVQTFLREQFAGMSLQTFDHGFDYDDRRLTNIVAHIPGQVAGSVTVGAHYDSRPFDGAAPGAEDNGSGLAAMLEIARAASTAFINGVKPLKTIYFAAFAGEEAGLLGSEKFAKDLDANELPDHVGASVAFLQGKKGGKVTKHEAIVLDEVGWKSPKMVPTVNLESYDWADQDVMQHLADACKTHNGDALRMVHNKNPFGSDHMSFLDLKMSASLLINGDDEAYPHYHSADDIKNADDVNTDYIAMISKMGLGALVRIAGVSDVAAPAGVSHAATPPLSQTVQLHVQADGRLGV